MLTLPTSHFIRKEAILSGGAGELAALIARRTTNIQTSLSSDELWELLESIRTNFETLNQLLRRYIKQGKSIEFRLLSAEAKRIVIADFSNIPDSHRALLHLVIRDIPTQVLHHSIS